MGRLLIRVSDAICAEIKPAKFPMRYSALWRSHLIDWIWPTPRHENLLASNDENPNPIIERRSVARAWRDAPAP